MSGNPFLLDCDTGIDDALALAYLVTDPNAELVAITNTFGNVNVEQAARNTLDLLALFGHPDIPVSVGAEHSLKADFDGGAPQVHGINGVGDVTLPRSDREPSGEAAAQTIIRLAHHYQGELNIVAIGPLTNIATAVELDPELPKLIKKLTLMGGAAMVPGNISPVAEANIGNDPEAADAVFRAGWPITVVPLDVTMSHTLELAHLAQLSASPRPAARTLAAVLECYFYFYTGILGRRCSALHDPMAAAIATGSISAALAPAVMVEIDSTSGPGRGQTICDLRGSHLGYPAQPAANATVVLSLDEPFAPILMNRLLAL